MIGDTISKIEARLRNADSMSEETRQELINLLRMLRTEITDLSKTDAERAEKIAGHTETFTRAAICNEKDSDELQLSLDTLTESVEGFETSHPKLVEAVNRICTTLSNLGI